MQESDKAFFINSGDTFLIRHWESFHIRPKPDYFFVDSILGRRFFYANPFWHNAFVHYTINKAFDIRNKLGQCIIADVRFDNECNVIKVCGGKIIRVDRRVNNDNHESEQIKICDDDYVIDNTGTLVGLFYKVLKFVTDYMV